MTKRATQEIFDGERSRHLTKIDDNFVKSNVTLKKTTLRNNEYYGLQQVYDKLYFESTKNVTFNNLVDLIKDDRNLLLAFRNIKTNGGSVTPGVNKHTISFWENKPINEYLQYMKNRIDYYVPMQVRRTEIPKANGKKRPLGIPTIEDRLIQQAIKQVLEPICEAKFYKYSFGFRPNRSTHHAVAYFMKKVNIDKCHYVVDIDIKGFFDNVNHGKLLKQMWTLGIRDKNLLCIISKMLKAEVKNIGIPTKGTPQGGILSPLLSNIVLNELDWWISSQWETMKTKKFYSKPNGLESGSHKYRALRKSSTLKEIYIVRYADDFKILCKDYKTAQKVICAVKLWLKERLKLDISPEKSKVTNLRKSSSEFLGFTFRVFPKNKKYVIQSHISKKAKSKILNNMQDAIKRLQKHPTVMSVGLYNAKVLGVQNYYRIATQVNRDLGEVTYKLSKKLKNRIKSIESKTGLINEVYKRNYKNNYQKHFVAGVILYPLADIQNKPPINLNQKVCDYTEMGRNLIHKNIAYVNPRILKHLMVYPDFNQSVLFNDNRLSLYAGQAGRCALTNEVLKIGSMEVHHITPKAKGGTDKYQNLVYLTSDAHHLIHYTELTIMCDVKLSTMIETMDDKTFNKLQKYRSQAGSREIGKIKLTQF